MMSFQVPSEGREYSVYLPAGTFTPPIFRSISVVNDVASLAPVRHTLPYGASSCPTLRPLREGRLYSMLIFLPLSVTSAVPGGLGRWLLSCCAKARAATRMTTSGTP